MTANANVQIALKLELGPPKVQDMNKRLANLAVAVRVVRYVRHQRIIVVLWDIMVLRQMVHQAVKNVRRLEHRLQVQRNCPVVIYQMVRRIQTIPVNMYITVIARIMAGILAVPAVRLPHNK